MSLPGNTPFRIRPSVDDDTRYVRATWLDSHHRSPDCYKMTFRGRFKEEIATVIDALIVDASTSILCAEIGDRIIGWIAYQRGRSISTVHYAYVRYQAHGEGWRRRGVASALLDAAELGRRFVYTHHGEYKRGGHYDRRFWPRPLDEEMAAALQRDGVTAVYTPIKEWLK